LVTYLQYHTIFKFSCKNYSLHSLKQQKAASSFKPRTIYCLSFLP